MEGRSDREAIGATVVFIAIEFKNRPRCLMIRQEGFDADSSQQAEVGIRAETVRLMRLRLAPLD
jgi:hypothetical protein